MEQSGYHTHFGALRRLFKDKLHEESRKAQLPEHVICIWSRSLFTHYKRDMFDLDHTVEFWYDK